MTAVNEPFVLVVEPYNWLHLSYNVQVGLGKPINRHVCHHLYDKLVVHQKRENFGCVTMIRLPGIVSEAESCPQSGHGPDWRLEAHLLGEMPHHLERQGNQQAHLMSQGPARPDS